MNKWMDIGMQITPEGHKVFKVGQVLMFKQPDGEENNLKIMRMGDGKIWVKHVVMYKPDELLVKVSDKKPKKRKK